VDRTFVGNLDQLVAQGGIDVALDRNDALEAIDLSLPSLGHGAAVRAVVGCDLAVPDVHGYPARTKTRL
jgi:hypothetical protein